MKNIIASTAGHIDHGKTALVKALTGTDADRLAEEKRRGITIDIGFAHLQLAPDLRIGFIDVPGHERFVHNMLAGAAGIDIVLFVVAADESIMPQTREHFEICRLLGVTTGVVALTRSDLVDEDLLQLARLEAEEFFGAWPVIPVSSKTGSGLGELLAALDRAARAAPEKDASGWFRMPVDRAFTIRGFGTVVTGTLMSGTVASGEEVELYPTGRTLRVRGIQVYGEPAETARAGERAALNLLGIEKSEIERGMVLSVPGLFVPVRRFECTTELLEPCTRAHLHAGTASTLASVRPGRIRMRDPMLLLPGDRFILRSLSPLTTVGGGIVKDFDLASRPNGIRRGEFIAKTGRRDVPEDEWLIAPGYAEDFAAKLTSATRAFHATHSLLAGIPKQDLKAAAMPGTSPEIYERALSLAAELVTDGEIVRIKTHRVVLRAEESQARQAIEEEFRKAGLTAPAMDEVLKSAGVEAARARTILQMLLKEGRLIRVSTELVLHADAVGALRRQLASQTRFSVPEFKEMTGISRKYAIPLLEYLDRQHVTKRDGDSRVVTSTGKSC